MARPLRAALATLMMLATTFTLAAPSGATTATTTPYFADFETPVGSEWSNAARTTSPNGAHQFLGTFYRETVTLSLAGLPAHDELRIAFKVHIIESWDGEAHGPDSIRIGIANGPTLMHASFSNIVGRGPEQSYPDPFGTALHPARTGASAADTLGYSFFGDSTYDLEFVVPHSLPSVVIEFEGRPNAQTDNDADVWGLDDVSVEPRSAAGLLAHFTFDEGLGTTVHDVVGSAHGAFVRADGTACAAPGIDDCATWGAGVRGGALVFPPSATYGRVEMPATPALDALGANGAAYTVAFWIRDEPYTTGDWRSILHKGSTNEERTPSAWLWPSSQRLHFRTSTSASVNEGMRDDTTIAPGVWTHLAFVHEQGVLRLYKDGALSMQDALAGTTVANGGPLQIHDRWYPGFTGAMDDLRLYSRALTTGEVARLAGQGACSPAAITMDDTTLPLLYPGAGTAADPHLVQGVAVRGAGIAIAVVDTARHVVIRGAQLEDNAIALCIRNARHVRVEDAVITGNDVGIATEGDAALVVTMSEIVGNAIVIVTQATDAVSAPQNYWGSPSGPGTSVPSTVDVDDALAEPPRLATDFLLSLEGTTGNNGFFRSDVHVRLAPAGDGQLPEVELSLDGGPRIPANGAHVAGEGQHTLTFFLDPSSQTVAKHVDIGIDLTSPVADLAADAGLHLVLADGALSLDAEACVVLRVLETTSELYARGTWHIQELGVDLPLPDASLATWCPREVDTTGIAPWMNLTWAGGADGSGRDGTPYRRTICVDQEAPHLEISRPRPASVSLGSRHYEHYGPLLNDTGVGPALHGTPAEVLATHAIVAGRVPIAFHADDACSGIVRIETFLDGDPFATLAGDARSLDLDTRGRELGEHTLALVAYDGLGKGTRVELPLLVVPLDVEAVPSV